jgi:hypothetical protein
MPGFASHCQVGIYILEKDANSHLRGKKTGKKSENVANPANSRFLGMGPVRTGLRKSSTVLANANFFQEAPGVRYRVADSRDDRSPG